MLGVVSAVEVVLTTWSAVLLPDSLPDSARVHSHLDLAELGRLLVPGVEDDSVLRSFVLDKLNVSEMPLKEMLDTLKNPVAGDSRDFYEMLVECAEAVGMVFANALSDVACVLTSTGAWVAPSNRVFFPRRDDVDVPVDLPVPIVSVPEVEGLDSLLRDAGVHPFGAAGGADRVSAPASHRIKIRIPIYGNEL